MNKLKVAAALSHKYNHAEGICTLDGEITEWPEHNLGPKPTDEELALIIAEYDDYIAANDYKEKIKAEMPSAEAQLEALYELGVDGWKQTIKKIKDKYPPPA